jgi:hypothetical protein
MVQVIWLLDPGDKFWSTVIFQQELSLSIWDFDWYFIFYIIYTNTTKKEVMGSIPSIFTILKVAYVCNVMHPASRRQLGSYLIKNIKNIVINRLDGM